MDESTKPALAGTSLLAGLNKEQMAAVTAPVGATVVLAGAGSGKTRVLTRRIAWRVQTGDVDPDRVLALTFTRKAAYELRDRQRRVGLRDRVPAGTIHHFALGQLRQRWAENGTTPPAMLTAKTRFVAKLLPQSLDPHAREIVAEIDWARARMIEPDHYDHRAAAANRKPPISGADMAQIMTKFAQEKRRKRVVDFDDLLSLATRDLLADPHYCAAVQWRHRHFFVDEFQDVNPLQFRLLRAWLGDRDDLFVVGDPNQAIYSWNGADPSLLDAMIDEPGTNVVRLDQNYRSTPQILRIAGAALPVDSKLIPNRPDGATPTITSFATDEAEAIGVADRIRSCHSVNDQWSDQAVLVRTNAQLVLIERALAEWRIPTEVRNGQGPLGTPEVQEALRRITNTHDLRSERESLDEELASGAAGLTGRSLERRSNLAALSGLIHEYLDGDNRATGRDFGAWVATLASGDVGVDADAVSLATFHGAKGLEWPIVHMAGLEDGFVPIAYATDEDQLAEEHRLLYVALTRAETHLHLTWAHQRSFGPKAVRRDASPLLAAIDRRIRELGSDQPSEVDWRRHLTVGRNRIAAADRGANTGSEGADGAATETLAALRSWRERKARAAGVPGHVILSDALLQAIAERQPNSIAQLGAMPGMRPSKLSRYGEDLLMLCGRPPS